MITQQKQMKNLWSKNKMIAQQIKLQTQKKKQNSTPPPKKKTKQTNKQRKNKRHCRLLVALNCLPYDIKLIVADVKGLFFKGASLFIFICFTLRSTVFYIYSRFKLLHLLPY